MNTNAAAWNQTKKGQLISIQSATTVNVVVDSECFDRFKILKVWQNMTVLKRKKVKAMHNAHNRRDEKPCAEKCQEWYWLFGAHWSW